MKTNRLLFLILGSGVLLQAITYADPPAPKAESRPAESHENVARMHPADGRWNTESKNWDYTGELFHGKRSGSRIANRSNKGGHTGITKELRKPVPDQFKNSEQKHAAHNYSENTRENAAEVHQLRPGNSINPTKKPVAEVKTESHRNPSVRSQGDPRSIQPSLGVVRSRNASLSVIGGVATPKARTTDSIDGASVRHRTR